MNKEIIIDIKKGFNQSSKIMAFKLGLKASIILSSLIYKHNYWFGENRLINISGESYFYITYLNLEAETSIKQSSIKKAISELKKAGLIKVKRKGIPATNHYCLNEQAINAFEAKCESDYLKKIEDLNFSAKVDRDRFSSRGVIQTDEINIISNNIDNVHLAADDLIEQMRESTRSETYDFGELY